METHAHALSFTLVVVFVLPAWYTGPEKVVDTSAMTVRDAWAAAPDDEWAVGDEPFAGFAGGPTVMHFDGVSWETFVVDDGVGLLGAWGASPTDLWTVGGWSGAPVVLHYDGVTWVRLALGASGPSDTFRDVSGSGPNDVWIVGEGSGKSTTLPLIHNFDGSAFAVVHCP